MEVSGAAEAGVTVFVVLAGIMGVVGLALAAYLDVSGGRGRVLLLSGFVAAGVLAGLIGTMISGYTVRVGGWGSHLKDAGDPASGTASSGFDFPLGAVIGLVLLAGLLTAAATVLRRPL